MGSYYQSVSPPTCPASGAASACPGPPATTQTWTPPPSGLQDYQDSRPDQQKNARQIYPAVNTCWLTRPDPAPCTRFSTTETRFYKPKLHKICPDPYADKKVRGM